MTIWLCSLLIIGYVSIGLIFWSAMDGDPQDFNLVDLELYIFLADHSSLLYSSRLANWMY